MTKHTAGEWGIATIDGGAADDEIVTEVNGCMVNIAAIFGAGEYSEARLFGEEETHYKVSKEEAGANARLIAEAPKMYALLKKIGHAICDRNPDGSQKTSSQLVWLVNEAEIILDMVENE